MRECNATDRPFVAHELREAGQNTPNLQVLGGIK